MAAPSDTLALVVDGKTYTGWTSVKVSTSCEKMPNSFSISATDKNDGTTGQRNAMTSVLAGIGPGSACKILIGDDLILTGYVDKFVPSIGPKEHGVQIMGRGKTEDLVDCSVTPDIITGMEIITSSLLDLANALGKKFDITATSLTGNNIPVTAPNSGAPLVFNANLQQTPYEILEEVARYAGVLIYEGPDGNIILANVGTSTMASGFTEGVNIQAGVSLFSLDERFSDYLAALMSTNTFTETGAPSPSNTLATATDKGVPRFRPHIIISEQFQFGQSFAVRRAQWEAARRAGRSNQLKVTTDAWRDSAGTVWKANAFASIDAPTLKLGAMTDPWVIGEIEFNRDDQTGTTADLTLMPKAAFQPEPVILTSWWWDPTKGDPPAAGGGGATTPSHPTGGETPDAPSTPSPNEVSGPSTPAPGGGGAATPDYYVPPGTGSL